MKVVVLHSEVREGAAWDEEDVLVQAGAVSNALKELGHRTIAIPFSMNVEATIDRIRDVCPDLVFNLVETVNATGRFIHFAPDVLEYLKIPFTGSDSTALFTTSNKILAKTMMAGSGIPTPPWITVRGAARPECLPSSESFIFKSVWEHASVGLEEDSIASVETMGDLIDGIESCRGRTSGDCFAESYVEGREFNVSLMDEAGRPEVLPIAEILFDDFPPGKPRVVGYRAKWDANSFEYHHTPRSFEFAVVDRGLADRLAELSETCWEFFGLRGYARVDFRVDRNGVPWVLEVNSNPCLSPDSGFIAASERAGLDYRSVIERIALEALRSTRNSKAVVA